MFSLDVILDALIFSNMISLMAIGLTLTYQTLKVPNFAHGDLVTLGAYAVLFLYKTFNVNPYLALPLAFLIPAFFSLLTYLLIYKPLSDRGASIVVLMIASIAVEIILRNMLHIFADVMRNLQKTYYRSLILREKNILLGGFSIPPVAISSTLTTIFVASIIYLFLTKTKLGVAMRASIENPGLASVLGIDVNKVYSISWFIAGGLAGLAGLFLPYRMPADPEIGWGLLLKVFSASILGGLDNIFGAIAGGYIIGNVEYLGINLLSRPPINLSTSYRPALPLIAMILALLFVPKGITSINMRKIKKWLRRQ
ncbi:MAG TPA: branched-chain amino acid ABC transporter permease [Thermofilum sp.]|nr:branched-chain amino acid ABC transporter permease [Thermofilum sp.]